MIVSVKSLVALIEKEQGYINDAKNLPAEQIPDGYFEKMNHKQEVRLAELRRISSNKTLITKVEKLVNA